MQKARDSGIDVLPLEQQIGGMLPSDIKRLRQLEEQSTKRKKLVVDLSLDKPMPPDVRTKKF